MKIKWRKVWDGFRKRGSSFFAPGHLYPFEKRKIERLVNAQLKPRKKKRKK